MAATPTTSFNLPAQDFINETFDFSVTFDNTGTSAGYGPFFDLVVPQGITLGNASYLGISVPLVIYTQTATGWVDGNGVAITEHPYGSFALPTGTIGDHWYLVELPFGSFIADQPTAEIEFSDNLLSKANGTQVGTGLNLRSRGGFRYGNDALDNGDIVQEAGTTAQTITPKLLELTKTADAPEQETATGENFARTYTLTVNIANGEKVDNLQVRDVLPNNLVYVPGTLSISGATATSLEQPTAGVPQNAPNNDFVLNLGSVTGTTSDSDVVITYKAYAPKLDANSASVIDAASGNDRTALNESQVTGTYGGVAVSKGTTDITGTEDDPADSELDLKSIAIQKSVAVVGGGVAKSGAVLEYTLTFQISDYFSFKEININDLFSDGQRFDSSFAPTLRINGNNGTTGTTTFGNFSGNVNGTFTSDHLTGSVATGTNGATALNFNVSGRLINSAIDTDGVLVGDLVDSVKQSGTTATLVYRTVIQENFTNLHNTAGYTGDASVDIADILTNDVTISGKVVGSDQPETDTSSAEIQIPEPTASKSIYAIEGNTNFTEARVAPGQTVTYRLKVEIPIADIETLKLTDYLPLPVFEATELMGSIGAFSGVPAAGTLTLGPDHTLDDILPSVTPTFTTNGTQNTIAIDFGSFDDAQNRSVTLDLLFTVTATDDAFADKLKLTNQALIDYGSTNDTFIAAVTEIVQVELLQPVLNITKGVVSTNATSQTFDKTVGPVTFAAPGTTGAAFTGTITSAGLASHPIDANVTGVDAGDLVRFALVIENTGGSGAFDAAIKDVLPTGLSHPQNLRVTNGAGNVINFTGDLFTTGLVLTDDADGAIDQGRTGNLAATNGKNIIIITYDATVANTINPKQTLTSGAELLQFAGVEGGIDHTANVTKEEWVDNASTTAATPTLTLNLVETEISNSTNSNTQVVIGERVEYELVLTVPEGTTPNSTLVNTLPAGLSLANFTGLTVSPDVSSSTIFNVNSLLTNTTISGNSFTVNLGTLTNTNTDNNAPETMTLRFQAVVSNINGNQQGTNRNHTNAQFTWKANGSDQLATATDADAVLNRVTVVEPDVSMTKDVVVNGSGNLGDAGDPLEYTLTISHAANSPDAFDLTFQDPLSSKIIDEAITTVTDSAGILTANDFEIVNGTLQLKSSVNVDLVGSRTITIQVSGNLSSAVIPNEEIDSNATIAWSSLDGTVTNRSIVPSVTNDDERSGTGGVNDYTKSDDAPIIVENVEPIKSIVSTSETTTHNTVLDAKGRVVSDDVTIGEIVRYRLVTRLSEGQIDNLQIQDNLPAGLKFIDGTAKVGLVNTDTNNLSTSDAGLNGAIVANTNPDTFTPAFAFPDANVSASNSTDNDSYTSGTDIFFKLGDIINTGTNAGSEYVVIEFDALVLDEAGNTAAKTLTNTFDVNIGGSQVNTSSDATVTVVAPQLSITQVLTVNGGTTGDAGDVVTITLTVRNTGTADAYEVKLEDLLDPDRFDLTKAASVSLPARFSFDNSIPGKIVYRGDSIAQGATETFTFTVPLKTAVHAGETLVSQAKITEATTIDGTPISGIERDIANPEILANDQQLTIDRPIATKSLTNTSTNNDTNKTVNVGEILTYAVTIAVPEGTTTHLQLVDTLDPGLAFVDVLSIVPSSGDVTTSAGVFAPSMGIISNASSADIDKGRVLTANLGNVTNSNTDDHTPESIVITYRAVVLNADLVNDGTTHDNTAVVSWTAAGTPQSLTVNSGDVTVSEPKLALEVQVLDDSSNPVENVQGNPGDTVTIRVTVSSNGSDAFEANAFDLAFSNSLPAGMTFVPGSITPVSGVTPTTSGFSAGQVNVTYDSFTDGSTSVFAFQVTLDGTVTTGEITNSGQLTYTSIAGTVGTLTPNNPLAGERTGDTSNIGTTANDLQETNTALVTMTVPTGNISPQTVDGSQTLEPGTSATLMGLGGSDTDGTVTKYRIETLPDATDGVLYLGSANPGNEIQLGQEILAGQIGDLVFVAHPEFNGGSFTYRAIDNTGTPDPTPATYTLTPTNIAPNTNPTSQEVVPGDTNSLSGLLGSDPDGTVELYQITTLPTGGTLYIGDPASGGILVTKDTILTPTQLQNLVFDAQSGFTGTTFTYSAIDNDGTQDSTPATVTLTTGNVPPETEDAIVPVSPNSSVSLTSQLVATDPDGNVSTYTILTLPKSGQLLLNGNPVNAGDQLAPAQLSNLTFIAGSNFTNTSFTYTATDEDGDSDRTPATIFLKTPGSNLPPIAPDASIAISEGTTIDLPDFQATDPDGTISTYTIDTLPTGGTLYLGNPVSGGTLVTVGTELSGEQIKQLFFQAESGFSGSSFTYTATDNTGDTDAGTITLTPGNLPPQTQGISTNFKPGETRLLTGLGGSDPDGSIAYYTITSLPSGGILYIGNPSDGIQVKSGDILTPDQIQRLVFQSGTHFTGSSFTYTTTDDLGLTDSTPATVSIGLSTAVTPNPEPNPNPEPEPNPEPNPNPEPTPNPEPEPNSEPDPKDTDNTTTHQDQDCCPIAPTLSGLEIAPPNPILGTEVEPPIEPDSSRFSRTHTSGEDDAVRGNNDQNDIWGDRGNDTLTGDDGDDRLAGDSPDLNDAEASGKDRLYGGAGHDQLNGNEKSDTVSGGDDNDIAYGGKDGDLISGDLGNDTLGGDLGDDTLLGSLGRSEPVGSQDERDKLYGNRGQDLLKGGEGEDDIRAGKENDLAYGGKDNDQIYGELGNDTLTGDLGDDILRGGTEDTTNPDTEGQDSIDGATGNDILFGNEKEDILRGGNGGDRLHGGKDGDFMSGDLGNDILYGERGNDTILGSLGRSASVGNTEEQDLLSGNDGNDILKGGEGEDSIYAGKDNDLVYAGKDNDLVYGDHGSDTLVGDQGNDTISGGNGQPDDPENVNGQDVIFGGDGEDVLEGNVGNDYIVGGLGNDIAYGGKGNDLIWGETENDLLFGDLGNDTLCGGDGDDILVGSNGNPGNTGDGNDMMCGGSGNDSLYGNEGKDYLYGNSGEDTLLGGKQNDTLKGGDGDDFLAGEQGSDRLIGGAGSDVFHITVGGVETIADFQIGVDRLVFSGGFTPEQLILTQVNNSTVINLGTEQLAILEGVRIDRLSDLI